MNVLLISCYELGHQPFALASSAAHLLADGNRIRCLDLAVQELDTADVAWADVAGISVPMHTAIRLGVRVGDHVRAIHPDCHIVYFGLYASLNADYLLGTTADSVIGGEFETPLAEHVARLASAASEEVPGVASRVHRAEPNLNRQRFLTPARHLLPPLNKYARLQTAEGNTKLVGYVEASRGCAHRCTHCPIPAVYGGRLRIVQSRVVLDDIANLVGMGAEHINFGDPDFLNGIKHSLRIVRAMNREFPSVTFDFTAKIEHLLEHEEVISELGGLGCLFILSAVESIDEEILRYLDKGHNKDDIVRALQISREAGVALRPSLLPFTPWTTLSGYLELLDFVGEHGLVYHIDPVQYSIRLLVPPGSSLLKVPMLHPHLGDLIEEDFMYEWKHPDPRMDGLQREVAKAAEEGVRNGEDAAITFFKIKDRTLRTMLGHKRPTSTENVVVPAQKPPKLTEDWFC
jgi:radical SAM superfamily enzyme YgiQ (UPF0313 family)